MEEPRQDRAKQLEDEFDVRLRGVSEADLPVFFEQQLDPEAVRMAAFPARDREAFDALWARILADDSLGKQTVLVDGKVAGNVVCWDADGERLVGYWIGRAFWGRGVATRALAAFLATEPARPLHARVARHNVASIRVLEKCGFVAVGTDTVSVDGETIEELVMTLGPPAPSE